MLIDLGWIKIQNFLSNANKLNCTYRPTSRGRACKAALPTDSLERKMVEFEALKAKIQSLQREF